jgi:TrmH family RNA methyltransferase
MFRSAESFAVEKLYLSPLCADPRHPRAFRTAMGAVDIVPWERLSAGLSGNGPAVIEGPFFALETGGIRPEDFDFPQSAVMIAGSEELGVSPEALELADRSLGRLSIPVYGAKGSLNVSVAFGIALHTWAAALHG